RHRLRSVAGDIARRRIRSSAVTQAGSFRFAPWSTWRCCSRLVEPRATVLLRKSRKPTSGDWSSHRLPRLVQSRGELAARTDPVMKECPAALEGARQPLVLEERPLELLERRLEVALGGAEQARATGAQRASPRAPQREGALFQLEVMAACLRDLSQLDRRFDE